MIRHRRRVVLRIRPSPCEGQHKLDLELLKRTLLKLASALSLQQVVMNERRPVENDDPLFIENPRTRRKVHVVPELVLLAQQAIRVLRHETSVVQHLDWQNRRHQPGNVRVSTSQRRLVHQAAGVANQGPVSNYSFKSMNLHEHWEDIYTSRPPDVVSWYEPVPLMSRKLVVEACGEGAESVIDVGGGSSRLVDELLDLGIKRVAVLDISETGLAVSKRRLGSLAREVEWIVADVTKVEDIGRFDVWHDRAVFHFLTGGAERRHYVRLAEHTLRPGRTAVMATFASDGPERCSGLAVRRYDAGQLAEECGRGFELDQSERYVHTTPGGSHQNFLFATFHRTEGK
jgi:SAM-dependent methyltransferase